MSRTVLFTDGGIILWSKQEAASNAVPNALVNDFIARYFIQSAAPEHTDYKVEIERNVELGVNTLVVTPTFAGPTEPELAKDVTTIFSKVHPDFAPSKIDDLDLDKFDAMVTLRFSKLSLNDPSESESEQEQSQQSDPEPVKPTKPTKNQPKRPVKPPKKPKKEMRRWDGTQGAPDGPLDYSEQESAAPAESVLDESALREYGSRKGKSFVVAELSSELDSILADDTKKDKEPFGFFRSLVGGKKLDEGDLTKALKTMEDRLVSKNVAQEAAQYICNEVRKDLLGSRTQTWTSVKSTVNNSVCSTLRRLLTPSTSLDLLHEIEAKRKAKKGPYVISVVGVNGVGKSTNLGKIAFWLLQNNMRVLIAACDTFRSGAVEQLKVHVDRLAQLTARLNSGEVDLFDQGYGKDAAAIAKKAVEHGQRNGFDVVLIDTAGRRHNDDRLMSSLEKFGKLAAPDKIVMVGEALVGTDSVAQARNFDAAFGKDRHLDFFLVSKCDTVGDMLGTLVNMTYSTGVPVLFVGVGQNYTDLRTLSIDWAVNMLMG